MRLKELDLIEFLPQYLREDKSAQGIVYAATKLFKEIFKETEKCNIYGRIDELDSNLLDELAWQFNVPEYIPTLDIVAKRAIIKNCIQTHKRRGTVAAVEKVIEYVFANGYVEEWFEYDGDPYHFKIHTTNVTVTDAMINEFEKLVSSTQNVRSVLENVVIETGVDMSSYQGIFTHLSEIIYI